MSADSIVIRSATAADANAYWRIEQMVYSGSLAENKETFLARVEAYPAGCKIAEVDGKIAGYLIAHPWLLYSVPPLQLVPFIVPENPDCFYIQNLALDPDARGKGVARLLLQEAFKLSHLNGFTQIALVSVQDSLPFWERMGFRAIHNAEVTLKLAEYGIGACYMVQKLTIR